MALKKPYKVTPETNGPLNILIYGYQGTGKTRFAGTASEVPEMRDVLFLNIEGGLRTVSSQFDVIAVNIKEVQEVKDIFWALREKVDGYETVNTVVIDSISALQDMWLEETRKRLNISATDNTKNMQLYGAVSTPMKDLMRAYRDLPVHVILTALRREEHEREGMNTGPLKRIIPAVTPSVADGIMGYQDFNFCLLTHEDKENKTLRRFALTRDYNKFCAKVRGQEVAEALGLFWENPNVPELYRLDKGVSEEDAA